jgi:COP9 signalosome complex subunit 1
MQDSALRVAENYETQALDRLRRMGLAAAELEFRGGKKLGAFAGDMMVDETLG